MNKKSLLIAAAVILVVLAAALAWNFFGGEEGVSAGAEAVIRAATTGPNPDLYNPEASMQIGLGAEPTEEERAAAQKAAEQQQANWEAAVGQYFAEGALEQFINNGYAMGYLMTADAAGQTLETGELTLVEKTDSHETVDFTYLLGGTEYQARAEFSVGADGLISRAEFVAVS